MLITHLIIIVLSLVLAGIFTQLFITVDMLSYILRGGQTYSKTDKSYFTTFALLTISLLLLVEIAYHTIWHI